MKKIYIFALVGLPVFLVVGFFWLAHLFFVPFEYREGHNGVGWGAFSKSIRKHIQSGPSALSDFKSYEGTLWFDVTDRSDNSYRLWVGRENYSDARNMDTLKRAGLGLVKIGGRSLVCENNLGEKVKPVAGWERSGDEAFSLNQMIEMAELLALPFGESLPKTYPIVRGELTGFPDGLSIDVKRDPNCCGNETNIQKVPTAVSCRLAK